MILVTILRLLATWTVTFIMSLFVFLVLLVDRHVGWFYGYARVWARIVLAICGVHVHVKGAERLKRGQPYVYVSNHASQFDIPAILGWIPDNVHIVYKKELSRVPIWGWMLALSPYVAVERENPREASGALDQAAARIRDGRSVMLFAEGTRTRTGSLLPFKRGAFTLAAKSGVPIAPVILNNTFSILPKGSLNIRSSHIDLIIDEPIPTAGMEGRDKELQLMDQVRKAISDHYIDQS